MSNYGKMTIQDVENINGENSFRCMSNKTRELFRCALSEALDLKIHKIEEEVKNIKTPPPSKRHKIQMNRLFRERVGGSFLPFPEEDNLYERVRSKVVIKLKINDFIDRRKKRKRAR